MIDLDRRRVPIPAVLRDHVDASLPDAPPEGRLCPTCATAANAAVPRPSARASSRSRCPSAGVRDCYADRDAPCVIPFPSMPEWIYFIHPPRENFAATMTEEEQAVWGVHFERLKRLLDEGTMIAVGPTLGAVNTGITIFEAPDEETARRIMDEDPVIEGGFARGELRPFKLSLLRGRD